MLEHYVQIQLKHSNYWNLFVFVLVLALALLGVALYFEISFFSFLILLAVSLTYPFIQFLKEQDEEELSKKFSEKALLKRHAKELISFWVLFLGLAIGFYTALMLNPDTYLYDPTIGITGVGDNVSFIALLLNNLGVFFLTFFLCCISVAALIFIIQWSALLFALFLSNIGYSAQTFLIGMIMLSHSLLEVGGYIIAGLCGILLSVRYDVHEKKIKHSKLSQLQKDLIVLMLIGVAMVILGAIVESF